MIWDTAKGGEYILVEKAVEAVRLLNEESRGARSNGLLCKPQ